MPEWQKIMNELNAMCKGIESMAAEAEELLLKIKYVNQCSAELSRRVNECVRLMEE